MPRGKRVDSDGNPSARPIGPQRPPERPEQGSPYQTPALPPFRETTPAQMDKLTDNLWYLSCRDGGYFKLTGKDAGKTVYLKWKWTMGALADTYVMVVVPYQDVAEGLDSLVDKINLVQRGQMKSISDKWHG